MKVKTNTGETVDLGQPENVRRGMVLGTPDGSFCVERYEPSVDALRSTAGRMLAARAVAQGLFLRFLGMDPAHADRTDCERFGLAPNADAGAHGFARTREGFAVDMRRCATLGIVKARGDFHWTCVSSETLREGERFIGLNAAHASAKDMERLCCGAHRNRPQPGAYLVDAARCTLAIGHDGDHEAIASGVKWADPVRSIPGPLAFQWTSLPPGSEMVLRSQSPAVTHHEAAEPMRSRIVFNGVEDGAIIDRATLDDDGAFSCACGSTVPADHREGCLLPWQYRMAATWAVDFTNARGEGLTRAVAEGLFGACAVALLAWICAMPETLRRDRVAREAPLVALVAAVPEGLDPVGWRAAVLAVAEAYKVNGAAGTLGPNFAPVLAWAIRGGLEECDANTPHADGVAAYRRAIAPHKAPPPERKTRGPRLTVDDGRDE